MAESAVSDVRGDSSDKDGMDCAHSSVFIVELCDTRYFQRFIVYSLVGDVF